MNDGGHFFRPDWPVPAHVKSLFTGRAGGVSQAPYDSLNLGDHVGDDARAVARNRARLQGWLAAGRAGNPAHAVFLHQVHGCEVASLHAGMADGATADAAVASQPGQVCAIMVADCLPVLFAHRSARVVAAAHAGWRGLAGSAGAGVLETAFAAFAAEVRRQSHAPRAADVDVARETLVWLGPCIGPQAFEVGAQVFDAFAGVPEEAGGVDAAALSCFTPLPGAAEKWMANLPALSRLRLQRLGIGRIHGNDGSLPWCTYSNPARYFSHRRDVARLGASGRQAACIWLDF